MANYYGSARTNFFKVKHPEFFKLILDELSLPYDVITESGESHFMLEGDDNSGNFPSWVYLSGLIKVHIEHPDFSASIIVKQTDDRLDKALMEYRKNHPDADEIPEGSVDMFFTKALQTEISSVLPDAKVLEIEHMEDDEFEVNLDGLVWRHLHEGTVVVFMEVGAEKLRYLCGSAYAVDHTGDVVTVSINQIYGLAASHFGVDESSIVRCEYTERA